MIWIDDREGGADKGFTRTGSLELKHLFDSHRTRPQSVIRRLPAGDIAFPGEGDKGPCMVGIERKRLKDLLSSKRTGRLSGEQLPKLIEHYEWPYILVEGEYRTSWRTGNLEEPYAGHWREVTLGDSPFLGMELDSFLNELRIRLYPLDIVHTRSPHDTVETCLSIEHFHRKPIGKRHEHLALHVPSPAVTIGKASTVRRVAFTLSGVGWERSGAVEGQFRSVADMVEADPKKWQQLPGFGRVLSQRVWDELHGVHPELLSNNSQEDTLE